MLRRELGEAAQCLVGTTEVEQRSSAQLLEGQQQLLEPVGLAEHDRGVAVGVRQAPRAPAPRRPAAAVRGRPRARQGVGRERLEGPGVDVGDVRDEGVAGRRAHQPRALARLAVGLELRAQPRDRDLQRGERLARRLVAPDLGDESLGGHRRAVGGQQHREHAALATARERHLLAVHRDRHRAEGGVPHAHAGHARSPPRSSARFSRRSRRPVLDRLSRVLDPVARMGAWQTCR